MHLFISMKVLNPARLTLVCALLAIVSACKPEKPAGYQGYLEADYAYIASAASGRLVELKVERGAQVQQGATLYVLDAELAQAGVLAAQSRVAQAKAGRIFGQC